MSDKITKHQHTSSFSHKVRFLIASQLVLALIAILLASWYTVNQQLTAQTQRIFTNTTSALNSVVEQHIRLLAEGTSRLSTNKLMINALTDHTGREDYLQPLATNFRDGKDVLYLNVVDFLGKPLFTTGEFSPSYNQSAHLRNALALGQLTMFIDKKNQLIMIAPIEYYSTSQGALIVAYDLNRILERHIEADTDSFVRLYHNGNAIFARNFDADEEYYAYLHHPDAKLPYFHKLDLQLEMGLPISSYQAPMTHALALLAITGVALLIVSLISAHMSTRSIVAPIIELHHRVQLAMRGKAVKCSPLGSHDELETLAEIFDARAQQLEHEATIDSLTDLPNRALFLDRLRHALVLAKRSQKHLAIIFIDLDRFKSINDSYGHSIGDKLLHKVAQTMRSELKEADTLARIGGDEFAILIEDTQNEGQVANLMHNLQNLFVKAFNVEQHQFFISSSMGAALFPQDGNDGDSLLRNADAAMYEAKGAGKNTFRFYHKDLTAQAIQRLEIENDLRVAIQERQFVVYFQPQFDMRDGTVMGMEALVRWPHPSRGLIPPNQFISIAEETGLIGEIDKQVMQQAMHQFAEWKAMGLEPGELSLNLSMMQLKQQNILQSIVKTLGNSSLHAKDIRFEVTETQAMSNPAVTIDILHSLRQQGFHLAIDDFGTGFSSLSYLKRFPVDKIKIDQSFIKGLPEDLDDTALVQAMITMARGLGMKLIAEGVEKPEQAQLLQKLGCYAAQGYLYSRPLPAKDITAMLQDKSAKTQTPAS